MGSKDRFTSIGRALSGYRLKTAEPRLLLTGQHSWQNRHGSGQRGWLALLHPDFGQANTEAVAGLRGSQLGERLDVDDHVLGLHRLGQRHLQVC